MNTTLQPPATPRETVSKTATELVSTTPGAMVWSASRLKRYLTCPRQFRYCYIDGLPSVPGGPLVLGRVLHETILYLHEEQMASGQLPPVEQVLEEFENLWRRALQAEQPFFRDRGPDAMQAATAGREMLRLYHQEQQGQPAPLLVEMPFEIMVDDTRVCGVIDRIDEGENGLIVTDFKSGRKAPQGEVERDLQLTLYAHAAHAVLGLPVERVAWHYLKDGTVCLSTRTAEQCEHLTQNLLPHVVMAVEREEFDLRPGYWCRWCDYREVCLAENPTMETLTVENPLTASMNETRQGGNDGGGNAGNDQHRQ